MSNPIVSAALDKNDYAPGDTATLTATYSDPDNQSVPITLTARNGAGIEASAQVVFDFVDRTTVTATDPGQTWTKKTDSGSVAVFTCGVVTGAINVTVTAADQSGNKTSTPVLKATVTTPTTPTPPTTPPTISTTWPDATNTGPTAAMKASGSVTSSADGQVIQNLDITGTLTITHKNVTVKNVRVTSTAFWAVSIKGTGCVMEDCKVDSKGLAGAEGSSGVVGTVTMRRCQVTGNENCVVPGNDSLYEDNYFYGLKAPGSPHYDGVQIDGGVSNITIRHNTIDNPNGQTSAVMIDNYYGAVSNVVVDNNKLTGGGYVCYADGNFASNGAITGIKYTNNIVDRGYYGPKLIRQGGTSGKATSFDVTWTGNKDLSGRTV